MIQIVPSRQSKKISYIIPDSVDDYLRESDETTAFFFKFLHFFASLANDCSHQRVRYQNLHSDCSWLHLLKCPHVKELNSYTELIYFNIYLG